MRKKTKALSGASQDAYFRRVLKAHPDLSAGERDKLVRRLRQEVAQLRVRVEPRSESETAPPVRAEPTQAAVSLPAPPPEPVALFAPAPVAIPAKPPAAVALPFDPFSPNVIVVLRKAGRDAALAALDAIDSPDNLRLLAREQRLTVGTDVCSAAELRIAIVAAAERRIANRMAAAT